MIAQGHKNMPMSSKMYSMISLVLRKFNNVHFL
jgi:hypothetical protein